MTDRLRAALCAAGGLDGAMSAEQGTTVGWGRVVGDPVVEAGSITKGVTGLLLALALEADEVRANAALRTLVPGVGRLGDATLAELATHTGGVPRLPRSFLLRSLLRPGDPYADVSLARLQRYAARTPRNAPPGTYSNLGVALLGQALAAAASCDYWSLAYARVLVPLGMLRSGDVPLDLSFGTAWELGAMGPAGGLRAPVGDLVRLAAAVADPASTPLESAVRDATTVHVPRGKGGVGWCWQITGRTVWHNGGTGSAWAFVGAREGRALAAWVGTPATPAYDRAAMAALRD